MNFLEFVEEVYASVFPDRDSPRLQKRHRNAIADALTRIQRYAACYRSQHRLILRPEETTFAAGITVFERPPGAPWEVRVERIGYPSDFVLAVPYTFAEMRAVAQTIGACDYPTVCGPYGYDEYGDYGNAYYPGNCAPPQSCLALQYAVSMDETQMFLYPALAQCAQVKVRWSGIKRTWSNADLIPWLDEDGYVDRDVMRAVETYLQSKVALDDNCNAERAQFYLLQHNQAIAELNMICSRRNEVVGPPILFPSAGHSGRECVAPEIVQTVATPVFDPPGGNYTVSQAVTLSSPTEGATIHYTIDGTAPTTSSPVYSQAIQVTGTVTLRAIAVKEGWRPSQIAVAAYTITIPTVAAPTFNPPAGSYVGPQMVTIMTLTPGATIFYTVDGNPPTTSSIRYTGAVSVPSTRKLRAIATRPQWQNSPPSEADYAITPLVVATPVITPGPGTYYQAQTVVVTCATAGAEIRYTTDGSEPEASDPLVPASFSVPMLGMLNLRVKAFKAGYITSQTAGGIINVIIGPPVFVYDKTSPQRYPWTGEPPNVVSFDITAPTPGSVIYWRSGVDTASDPNTSDNSQIYNGMGGGFDKSYQFKATAHLPGVGDSTVTTSVFAVEQPVLYGYSSNSRLTPSQLRALQHQEVRYTWTTTIPNFTYAAPAGAYDLDAAATTSDYFYIAWPEGWPGPHTPGSGLDGFKVAGTPLPMAAGPEGYNDVTYGNGWNYDLVLADTGTNYMVFRSKNALGGFGKKTIDVTN